MCGRQFVSYILLYVLLYVLDPLCLPLVPSFVISLHRRPFVLSFVIYLLLFVRSLVRYFVISSDRSLWFLYL